MDQLVDVRRTSLALWFALLFAKPPSDPPDYAKVRAKPLAKPERYDSLTTDAELELIRAYHEDGDLDALDRLVGAHRPMVVRTAKNMWRGTTPLRALVEYGMLGLRTAAQPPRPSKTKKGEMVGFDAGKGSRFSTYARHEARKEMQMAVSGRMVSGSDEPDILPDEFEHKTTATVEAWMALDDGDALLKDAKGVVRCLTSQQGRPARCPGLGHLWSLGEPKPRKVRPRNHLKHGITARELANRDLEYRGGYLTLAMYEQVAKDSMTGWLDGDDDHDPWEPATGGFNPKVYRLPKDVLKRRWKLAKERYENVPYSFNQGLGLYDKRGRKLPVYPSLDGGVTVIKRGRKYAIPVPDTTRQYILIEEADDSIRYYIGGGTVY